MHLPRLKKAILSIGKRMFTWSPVFVIPSAGYPCSELRLRLLVLGIEARILTLIIRPVDLLPKVFGRYLPVSHEPAFSLANKQGTHLLTFKVGVIRCSAKGFIVKCNPLIVSNLGHQHNEPETR